MRLSWWNLADEIFRPKVGKMRPVYATRGGRRKQCNTVKRFTDIQTTKKFKDTKDISKSSDQQQITVFEPAMNTYQNNNDTKKDVDKMTKTIYTSSDSHGVEVDQIQLETKKNKYHKKTDNRTLRRAIKVEELTIDDSKCVVEMKVSDFRYKELRGASFCNDDFKGKGSTKSLSEQNSCTDMNKKGQTSDMTDDKLDANKTADIEEQLGKLPDFLSDDEKAETKPVIKQEPMGPVLCAADFDRLREVIRHDTYTHCDVHKLERMERNVVCIQCQQLICALCLLNSHQSHDIRSVSSMNEYFNVKGTIEEDVSILQQEQNNLTVKFAQRKELKKKIEESSQNLIKDIGKRFDAIQNILHAKQENLVAYVKQFESQNISELTRELDRIRDLENAASRMITRAITFFSKIDLTLATVLPQEVHDVIDKCKCASIESLQNKEKYLPERKFSKLIPSLDAVASICDTIHAEATKVVWSKTTKNSDSDEKKAIKVKTEKRKHHSHSDHSSDNSKTFKKPKTATVTTVSSQSSGPITPHRSSTEKSDSVETDKNKRNTEKSLFESLTENVKEPVQGSKISHHRKSVDAATIQSPRHSTDHDDSESDKSDASTIIPPKLKLVDMKATNVETGKCLMAKTSEEDGQGEKMLLGKICGSSKMKETTQYTVNWFKGEAGRDTSFELRKKQSPLHSSCVLCNFDFDHTKPMSQELKSELVLAKEYHNKKKTRKRKPKERNVSPKKDKDSSKSQTVVKK